MASDFFNEALSRVRFDGLLIENPLADGKLHRCPVEGKLLRKGGAYLIHVDQNPAAWWQNWLTGADGTYCEKGRNP